jgi:hypothetical protein
VDRPRRSLDVDPKRDTLRSEHKKLEVNFEEIKKKIVPRKNLNVVRTKSVMIFRGAKICCWTHIQCIRKRKEYQNRK